MSADRSSKQRGCAWCGVSRCAAVFDRCLAREFEDPAFFAVHHLTVAAYRLQHGEVTARAAVALRKLIVAHLHDTPTTYSMQQVREQFDGAVPVTEWDQPPPGRTQTVGTIASVDFSSAEEYCASVRRWAKSVAEDVT